MIIEYDPSRSNAFYFAMIQTIIPRPIAWVLSKNPNGSHNVAPFSFFNGVTSEPPIIMISVGWKDDATRKDTWVNIEERNDFVVHIAPVEQATFVVATSVTLPLDQSEIDYAHLTTIPVEGMPLPRLEGPKVAFFCQKYKIIEVGTEQQGLILGEIKKIWIDDSAVSKKGDRVRIDPKVINPLARLGGKEYSQLGDIFSVDRPK